MKNNHVASIHHQPLNRSLCLRKLSGMWLALTCVGSAGFAVAADAPVASPATAATAPYLASFPNFAPKLAPALPGDVDVALQKKLEAEKHFADVQRLFDLNAWQMFLALNWPTNDAGQPAPNLADTNFGAPHWTLFRESSDIFRVDGKTPAACRLPAEKQALSLARDTTVAPMHGLPPLPPLLQNASISPRASRVLANVSAVGEIDLADLAKLTEVDQAFSGPLVDQNGNLVHYEILLDSNEVGFLCSNNLYNLNGQITYSNKVPAQTLTFPEGVDSKNWSGALEVKLAWKILDTSKGDNPNRFFNMKAQIPALDTTGKTIIWKDVTVGLVGMHIAHKTKSSPQWIWATFEQVDNLVGDSMAHPPTKASFYDPNCEICVPNVQPSSKEIPTKPVQAVRAVQIPGEKIQLNHEAQATLAKLNSVWRYYELVDTQWPTEPSAKPAPWNSGLPYAVNNKPGGNPTPVFLTNITMETYFQKGVQAACHQEELPSGVDCPAKPGTTGGDATPIFASESCMGCHSSAGIAKSWNATTKKATFGDQLSGDFSWLLQTKAKYDSGK
ncbi:hypothetical protein ELE36_17840 [Pseudolysobacter antarcticus]|uniref:Cytochrome c domain-containing protein n=1 Tax=Pseudolysobacter antarcticus TaxID=2511995 RepID=A0A411HNL4_9GAMM|nr:hypothetical protein [Pseudolysobacter antarcticus]QBB72078.1 hypothetical protein ELE36_17840 [Pseudolysobacter antarcticus]